jgi:hypothetical protein
VVAAARHFSFPPPRTTSGGGESCRKMAAAQVDLGAAAMGSWLDSMKTSSPRHRLVDAEHDDWMVRTSCLRVVLYMWAEEAFFRQEHPANFCWACALAGAAPFGIGPVRRAGGGGEGEADRGVPGLRRHAVPDRGGPRQRRHDRRGE